MGVSTVPHAECRGGRQIPDRAEPALARRAMAPRAGPGGAGSLDSAATRGHVAAIRRPVRRSSPRRSARWAGVGPADPPVPPGDRADRIRTAIERNSQNFIRPRPESGQAGRISPSDPARPRPSPSGPGHRRCPTPSGRGIDRFRARPMHVPSASSLASNVLRDGPSPPASRGPFPGRIGEDRGGPGATPPPARRYFFTGHHGMFHCQMSMTVTTPASLTRRS